MLRFQIPENWQPMEPAMQRYANVGGDSGIDAFEIGDDYIRVRFQDGSIYRYTYNSAGSAHIEQMKSLALGGQGLNSYINRNVRKLYEEREV